MQQRVRRRRSGADRNAASSVAPVSGDLFFGGRNDGVGMVAEKNAAQAFAGEKTGSGALDAQSFDFLAAFALELLFGE